MFGIINTWLQSDITSVASKFPLYLVISKIFLDQVHQWTTTTDFHWCDSESCQSLDLF